MIPFVKKKENTNNSTISLIVNVTLLISYAFTFLVNPEYFSYVNSVTFILMMIHRLNDYFQRKYQFYMLDPCYAINLLVIFYTHFMKDSKEIFFLSYCMAC